MAFVHTSREPKKVLKMSCLRTFTTIGRVNALCDWSITFGMVTIISCVLLN